MVKKSKIDKDELIRMYVDEDMLISDISKQINVNITSIYKALKKYNVELKKYIPRPRFFYDGINKKCSICGEIKSVKEFQRSKKNRTTGLRGECNECRYKNRQEWINRPGVKEDLNKKRKIYCSRSDIKEKYAKKSKKLWHKNKDLAKIIKKDLGCQICGENRVECLEFHHIIPNKRKKWRKGNLYDTVNYFYSMSTARTLKEIAKCTVLCCNCHRLHHRKVLNQKLTPIDITPYLPTT